MAKSREMTEPFRSSQPIGASNPSLGKRGYRTWIAGPVDGYRQKSGPRKGLSAFNGLSATAWPAKA
jgi:hypothetical protein